MTAARPLVSEASVLPSFVIIGAAKAGTTALYWYLADHPQVFMSPVKETNYFAYGLDDEGNAPVRRSRPPPIPGPDVRRVRGAVLRARGRHSRSGEASPIYLECPQSAARIRETLPAARIICGLREPVDRAYSDYLMYLRARGRRLDPDRDLTASSAWARPDSHWMQISRYHEALSRYFDLFPREQIHVFLFEDFRADALRCVRDIYRSVGVYPGFVPDLDTPHNIGGMPSSRTLEKVFTSGSVRKAIEPWIPRRAADMARRLRTKNLKKAPPLPEDLKAELGRHFRDDIGKTSELIGQEPGALAPAGLRGQPHECPDEPARPPPSVEADRRLQQHALLQAVEREVPAIVALACSFAERDDRPDERVSVRPLLGRIHLSHRRVRRARDRPGSRRRSSGASSGLRAGSSRRPSSWRR